MLTSAESSVAEVSEFEGSTTAQVYSADTAAVTDRIKAVVTKESKTDEPRELPYVLVRTYPNPNNPSVRLADVTWAYASAPLGGIPPQSDAVRGADMSHENAMNRGFAIANTYGFPRLYWQRRETNMRLWKLEPIDPSDRNWAASTFHGEVVVRAEDEQRARRLAARAYGIATQHTPGEEVRIVPWDYAKLVTSVLVDPTDDYAEDGEAEIVAPTAAVESAHPGYNRK